MNAFIRSERVLARARGRCVILTFCAIVVLNYVRFLFIAF